MKLIVVEEGTRATLEFAQFPVRIGRAIDNDIRLAGAQTSRHHCRVEQRDGGAWVIDLGSANGTLVNGQRIQREELATGDVITVGGARLHVDELAPVPTGGGETQPIDEELSAELEALGQEEREADTALNPGRGVGLQTLGQGSGRERDNVRIFARTTRALVQETELSTLLRLIVDSAVQLVGGERGFLVLAPPDARAGATDPSAWKVRVARSFDQADIPIPTSRLSMGIATRVVEGGRPILSVDAGRDERFSGMASVEDMKLRSVLCVPVGSAVEGLLYVDNRLQKGAFTEDDLDLAELLADQAAIAIRNARMVTELRERNARLLHSSEQIKSLNEQLGRKIRDRDQELAVVRAELDRERGRYDYGSIVGASDEMKRVFGEMDRIIETELTVLIQGESGTGKELIARAIHFNGPRKERPFVAENCAAIPDTLLESELFGHTRGAFTGATRAKRGLMEQASGGTLFLDEIGDMSAEMQKKLLRVLQEGEVRPLGSNETVPVDVRLLAASHQDLEQLVKVGTFREDLFYRVNVITLRIPPLRERREDVPLLVDALMVRAAREAGRPVPLLPHEVKAALAAYDWPGNVRELENETRRLLLLGGETVHLDNLSPHILERAEPEPGPDPGEVLLGDLPAAVRRFERTAIQAALDRNGGNKSRAAKELGISRFALQRKLEKFGLTKARVEEESTPSPSGS